MLSKKLRNQIVKLYEQGFKGKAIATRLRLNPNRCKEYCLTIELFGKEAFFDMAGTKTKYVYETKLAAVKANLPGLSIKEVMAKHSVLSYQAVATWVRLYKRIGPEALESKPRGRRKKLDLSNISREEQLELRIKELEVENAVLKKVMALKASKR